MKHGSLNTTLETLIHPSLERDQGELMKSSVPKINSEWLWVLKSGKMIEIDNRGRPLQTVDHGESEEKFSMPGLDCWIG